MKGLLLKELYLCKKHCKVYFIMCLIFIAAYLAEGRNELMLLYPCFLSGMIPVNLLGFDEQSRFDSFAGTLPYTRAQIVSAKYMTGLGALLIMVLATTVVSAIGMNISHAFSFSGSLSNALTFLISGLVVPSLSLPFMFKLGVTKGRMAYFISLALVVAIIVAFVLVTGQKGMEAIDSVSWIVILGIVILLYAASWYLSIAFYRKREL